MAQQGLNQVMIIGFLGGTPELRFTSEGKAVAKFSVAVNERWKDSEGAPQQKVEWIHVVTFGRLAEICRNYLDKGRLVFLGGKLQTRNWDDREGQRRSATEVVANELRILDSPSKNGGEAEAKGVAAEDSPF
jgi:single-strand DNA-binding protein